MIQLHLTILVKSFFPIDQTMKQITFWPELPIVYPISPAVDVVDVYHDTAVADPFRWLEDPTSVQTQDWIAAQNQLTRRYLDNVPTRSAIHRRLTELWNYPKQFAPLRKANWYFFYQQKGLQNQPVLYRVPVAGTAPAEVVLDPNTLASEGTTAVTSLAISDDGSLLAYGLSLGGSDQQEIRVRHVATGQDYPERLAHCRFAQIAWRHDATGQPTGFYYNRYPQPATVPAGEENLHNQLYWHTPGTPQTADELVYARPDAPQLKFAPTISADGRFLILFIWHAAISRNRLYYRPLESQGEFIRLADTADAAYNFIGNVGDTFYVQTDWEAANGRIMTIDLAHPEREHWRELIPASTNVIADTRLIHQELVVIYLQQASHHLYRFGLDGQPVGKVPIPAIGSITDLTGQMAHSELFFKFESYLNAGTLFCFDMQTNQLTPWPPTAEPVTSFAADEYETVQVSVTSKDGTPVSMFLTHKKGLARNGRHPVLLYGYGGFSINHTPTFAAHVAFWLESGGIFADVHLRGGAEYGEAWHRAGMLEKKQTVFDDFIAAAEWLIAQEYTRPEHLAIIGRSNGGLLTAAVMLQRPDLFGAVLAIVPVTDMLRFHKFTSGRFWTDEYGNAETDQAHFHFLYAYSPLHNVRQGTVYPPILLTTADGDDRVVPLHALKFAATLQTAVPPLSPHPILLRVDTKSGHGLGKPIHKWIDEFADIYAFLAATIQPI